MRAALVAFVVLVWAGCAQTHHRAQRPAADVQWPPVAEATRTQWYRGIEHAPPQPITLTEVELEDALTAAAHKAGIRLVRTHYLPLLGGTAEIVLQPAKPESASRKLGELLGPLGHDNRPYLVTVVNATGDVLLVLGWTPHVEGAVGQGLAWEAPEFDSGVIFGKPVTRDEVRSTGSLPAALVGGTSK